MNTKFDFDAQDPFGTTLRNYRYETVSAAVLPVVLGLNRAVTVWLDAAAPADQSALVAVRFSANRSESAALVNRLLQPVQGAEPLASQPSQNGGSQVEATVPDWFERALRLEGLLRWLNLDVDDAVLTRDCAQAWSDKEITVERAWRDEADTDASTEAEPENVSPSEDESQTDSDAAPAGGGTETGFQTWWDPRLLPPRTVDPRGPLIALEVGRETRRPVRQADDDPETEGPEADWVSPLVNVIVPAARRARGRMAPIEDLLVYVCDGEWAEASTGHLALDESGTRYQGMVAMFGQPGPYRLAITDPGFSERTRDPKGPDVKKQRQAIEYLDATPWDPGWGTEPVALARHRSEQIAVGRNGVDVTSNPEVGVDVGDQPPPQPWAMPIEAIGGYLYVSPFNPGWGPAARVYDAKLAYPWLREVFGEDVAETVVRVQAEADTHAIGRAAGAKLLVPDARALPPPSRRALPGEPTSAGKQLMRLGLLLWLDRFSQPEDCRDLGHSDGGLLLNPHLGEVGYVDRLLQWKPGVNEVELIATYLACEAYLPGAVEAAEAIVSKTSLDQLSAAVMRCRDLSARTEIADRVRETTRGFLTEILDGREEQGGLTQADGQHISDIRLLLDPQALDQAIEQLQAQAEADALAAEQQPIAVKGGAGLAAQAPGGGEPLARDGACGDEFKVPVDPLNVRARIVSAALTWKIEDTQGARVVQLRVGVYPKPDQPLDPLAGQGEQPRSKLRVHLLARPRRGGPWKSIGLVQLSRTHDEAYYVGEFTLPTEYGELLPEIVDTAAGTLTLGRAKTAKQGDRTAIDLLTLLRRVPPSDTKAQQPPVPTDIAIEVRQGLRAIMPSELCEIQTGNTDWALPALVEFTGEDDASTE